MPSRRFSWVGCVTVSESPVDSNAAAMRSCDSRTAPSDAIGLNVENMAKSRGIRQLLSRSPQVVSVMKRWNEEKRNNYRRTTTVRTMGRPLAVITVGGRLRVRRKLKVSFPESRRSRSPETENKKERTRVLDVREQTSSERRGHEAPTCNTHAPTTTRPRMALLGRRNTPPTKQPLSLPAARWEALEGTRPAPG